MRQVLLITGTVVFVVSLVVGFFAMNQANQEQLELTSRLQSRSQVLADSLAESIEPSYNSRATSTIQRIIDRFASSERLAGLAIFDSSGTIVAGSENMPLPKDRKLVTTTMDSDEPGGDFVRRSDGAYYVHVIPLHDDKRVIGALALAQNATYIDESIRNIWRDNIIRLLFQTLVFAAAIFVLVRWVFFHSISKMVESLQAVRKGNSEIDTASSSSFFKPLAGEISKVTKSLRQARQSASEEARMRLEKLDTPWTANRLREFVKAQLKDRPIFMVTHLEPYIHHRIRNEIVCKMPASGLISAIEPVMEACGGLWIATGSGNADRDTADKDGKLRVPPDEPKYTLKRVWLSEEERERYDRGFCSETLWPLFHMMHVRPTFRQEDWEEYRRVNSKFAKIILREIKDVPQPLVFIQDFQFTLVPEIIKRSRPDAQISVFWHITWPNSEIFSTCPWKKEILEGMLGADVLGFHTQQFCNNFIETVSKEIEVLVNFEQFSITKDGHTSYIKPFPVGTIFTNGDHKHSAHTDRAIFKKYGIKTPFVGLGVERMDAIKGLLERFKAIEVFFETYPLYREKFTFLQVTAPASESIESRKKFSDEVVQEVKRVNEKLGRGDWVPIVHVNRQHTHEEIRPLYQAADVYIVPSLHDGMNLVSKEFVAAKNNCSGVLILSQFTGAARELRDAILVNPYDVRQTAEAIHNALTMPEAERARRMKKMREAVKNYNIYRWSAELIKALSQLE